MSQLEGSLQQPEAQSAMSPYLVPDTQALCQHLPVIRQLAASGRFIVIIPRTGERVGDVGDTLGLGWDPSLGRSHSGLGRVLAPLKLSPFIHEMARRSAEPRSVPDSGWLEKHGTSQGKKALGKLPSTWRAGHCGRTGRPGGGSGPLVPQGWASAGPQQSPGHRSLSSLSCPSPPRLAHQ